ncbi:MAG: hypothetical protein LBE86_02735 [Gemmobacter sp.]|jgi:hypothetical protein|nr:hypothetical protein [Gemmobacter sp.]
MIRLTILLALLPVVGLAQTPMTAEEFEAYVVGKTLTYAEGGRIFGTEQYLSGRRVRWAFTQDICQDGTWFQRNEQICFVYDNHAEDLQCWTFWHDGGRLRAHFVGDPDGHELTEVEQSQTPLHCAGPDVGA